MTCRECFIDVSGVLRRRVMDTGHTPGIALAPLEGRARFTQGFRLAHMMRREGEVSG